jgi:predicted nucleic acid-binding protein
MGRRYGRKPPRGRPMATSDAWIAATAIRWNLSLLTTDHRDFNHLKDLTLIPI